MAFMSEFIQSAKNLGLIMKRNHVNDNDVKQSKHIVQEAYSNWAISINNTFLNWGLWDKTLYQEYKNLDFNFSHISKIQDIYSQLLLYFIIRPLLKMQLFNKNLLEIGSGNGLGIRAGAELLKSRYALGIDLSPQLILNSHSHFHKANQINYMVSDAESLPLEDGCFDIIINLESSHIYPRVDYFFSEVERVLTSKGYFCYADVETSSKRQPQILEQLINKNKKLRIVQQINITKLVQASIYKRILANENSFYNEALNFFGVKSEFLREEILLLAYGKGLGFLPWWKINFKNRDLKYISRAARADKFWGKKHYFYYLIQKI